MIEPEQGLRGKASATFQLPITMAQQVVPDNQATYDVNFTFRQNKSGKPFGTPFTLKVKCV